MIYFDNGATTYPKPMPVLNKAYFAMKYYSFNSGRGGYAQSFKAAKMIYDVREKTADMFNCSPENVVFTKNCTEALNYAIKGSVENGGHIIISSLEHNSVARVAQKLSDDGVADYDIAEFSFDDDKTVNNFERLIKPNTSAIVCMHSSNVFGVVFPITKIGKMCKKHGVRFIVDAAQSAGVIDIDMKRDNIDVLCCPGHKSLYGNMGTGFMCVCDGVKLSNCDSRIICPTDLSRARLTTPALFLSVRESILLIKQVLKIFILKKCIRHKTFMRCFRQLRESNFILLHRNT